MTGELVRELERSNDTMETTRHSDQVDELIQHQRAVRDRLASAWEKEAPSEVIEGIEEELRDVWFRLESCARN